MQTRRLVDILDKKQQQFFKEREYDINQPVNALHPSTHRAPLHDAVNQNQKTIVRQLLEGKADVNQLYSSNDLEDGPSGTPLLLATYSGDADVVKLLIDHGANAENYDNEGVPLLSRAVWVEMEILAIVLRTGANVDQETFAEGNENNFMTPLMYAAVAGRLIACEMLIRYGALIQNSKGKSVFDCCFDETVKQEIKEYITRISSRTNELIKGLKSVLLPLSNSNQQGEIIHTIASYTAGGAYLNKNDRTYLSRVGLFSQRHERKDGERKASDDRKYDSVMKKYL